MHDCCEDWAKKFLQGFLQVNGNLKSSLADFVQFAFLKNEVNSKSKEESKRKKEINKTKHTKTEGQTQQQVKQRLIIRKLGSDWMTLRGQKRRGNWRKTN